MARSCGDLAWYEDYIERHAAEVVLCLDGVITLHQEHADGSTATVELTERAADRPSS